MEQDEKGLEFIKRILNNSSLLRWVKKFSADGLQNKDRAKDFDVDTNDDSISVSDTGMVKMFFSSSRFDGKTYASFDIKHIKEVLSLLDGEGRLIINESDNKRLCYIQSGDNVVVIAPTSETDEIKAKPKQKNKGKAKKENKVEEEDSDDEED